VRKIVPTFMMCTACLGCLILLAALPAAGLAQTPARAAKAEVSPDARFRLGSVLYEDNFQHGLESWKAEMEKPATVLAKDGVLDLDAPAGLTLWFTHELDGPVMISYDAVVVAAGGPNDRVSDLNCFWMASDPSSPQDLFAHPRSGAFPTYNSLHSYYVGLGGHNNTSTRFRRYIGDNDDRPLLPENDLAGADKMIVPNRMEHIRLVADGRLIQFYRGQERYFEMVDAQPYTRGWFGIRTTRSHLRIQNLKIVRLIPND